MVPKAGAYFRYPVNVIRVCWCARKVARLSFIKCVPSPPSYFVEGQGQTENIVCPLHRWTYALNGELLGAPHFPDRPCLNLDRVTLHNWRGLLFDTNGRNPLHDLAMLSNAHLDFSGYLFNHVEVHEYNYN